MFCRGLYKTLLRALQHAEREVPRPDSGLVARAKPRTRPAVAGVLAAALSVHWCVQVHLDSVSLCSAGFGQTVGSAVDKNLGCMVGVLSERQKTPSLALSVPLQTGAGVSGLSTLNPHALTSLVTAEMPLTYG